MTVETQPNVSIFKKEIVEEKDKTFVSAAIASITRANDEFQGSISGRSDRGKHWKEETFHGLLYFEKKLINIKILKILQYPQKEIFIVHLDRHLGILVKIFLGCFYNISFPLSFQSFNSLNF